MGRLKQLVCSHDWSPWRVGAFPSLSELEGDFSDEAAAFEEERRAALGIKGLPGAGMSEETYRYYAHQLCKKCGKVNIQHRPGVGSSQSSASAGDAASEGQLRAVVTFYFGDGADPALEAVVVDLDGDSRISVFLPAAYLDKILVDARDIPGVSSETLKRVSWFFTELVVARRTNPAIVGDGRLPLRDEWPTDPDLTIEVQLIVSEESERAGRLRAITNFEPPDSQNQTIAEFGFTAAELGFFAIWDTLARTWRREFMDEAIEPMRTLCSLYSERGIPSLTELGAAPFAVWPNPLTTA
jgi:hypothetical protein